MRRAIGRFRGDLVSITEKLRLWAAVLTLVPLTPSFVQAQSVVRLARSVSPAAAQIVNAGTVSPSMPMEIAVRLNLRNIGELEQLKRDQQDPSSASYHRGLTAAQFNTRFGPIQADADAVAQWLSAAGFVVTGIDLDRHLVLAQANAAVVSRAFDVAIARNAKRLRQHDRTGNTGGIGAAGREYRRLE